MIHLSENEGWDDYSATLDAERDDFNRQISACTKNISQLEESLRDMTVERDTLRGELEKAKAIPMKYRRMEFNAQLQNENARLYAELEECSKALPGPYYMDPPDGGSVTVGEQVARMAKDAARFRWLQQENSNTWHEFAGLTAEKTYEAIDAAMKAIP